MDSSEASELDYGGRAMMVSAWSPGARVFFFLAFCSVGVLAARVAAQNAAQDPDTLAARKAQGEGRDADAERISYFCHLLFAICLLKFLSSCPASSISAS